MSLMMAIWPYIKPIAKIRKCTKPQSQISKNISLKMHQVPIKTYNTSLWQPGCTSDGILRPPRANVRILFTKFGRLARVWPPEPGTAKHTETQNCMH